MILQISSTIVLCVYTINIIYSSTIYHLCKVSFLQKTCEMGKKTFKKVKNLGLGGFFKIIFIAGNITETLIIV